MLSFRPPQLEDRKAVEQIAERAKACSCQYGFPSIFCLQKQYGTEICIEDEVLFCRSLQRIEGQTTYFPPIGPLEKMDAALQKIEDLAQAEGKPWSFWGLTEESVEVFKKLRAGCYHFEKLENWSEYLYDREPLATLAGSIMAKKRHDAAVCLRLYGDRMEIADISEKDLKEIADFHRKWMVVYGGEKEEEEHLQWEVIGVLDALDHFDELGLRGVVLRIDGEIAAYSYGCVVGEDTFDIIAQKADYQYRNLYRIIFKELVSRCATHCQLVNCEEDLGLVGLRRLKESYHPKFLLHKWSAVRNER